MIVDSTQLGPDFSTRATVCIIGGGVAGISIALELEKKGISSCILESGSLRNQSATMDLNRGENSGLPYTFADGCRSRYLGGSSNCWGGWCAPMDEFDFEKRDWVKNSGWPISFDDLQPYYQRAHQLLQLGTFDYDPGHWEKMIGRADVNRMKFDNREIRDLISQFSPPTRFGSDYRRHLENSRHVTVYLNANVTNIKTNETGDSASRIEAATLKGNKLNVIADQFVLATGGIENARLLLLSNEVQKRGLGNEHDIVGRYFMDHPRLLRGNVVFNNKWRFNRLYDMKYNYHHRLVAANGTSIAGQLALTRETQEKEQVLNGRVCFLSLFPGETSDGVSALLRYKQAMTKKNRVGFRPVKDMISILANPLDVSSFAVTRYLRPRFLISETKIQVLIEQEPNEHNRVSLSNQVDSLGLKRVKVNWQPGEMEKRTMDKMLQLISERLVQNGYVKKIEIGAQLENAEWPSDLQGTWHHMGTTRMSDSPRRGVVDRNCRVHGMSNLFVAGSSVFSTSGPNFPTITLTALAVRLADYIAGENVKRVVTARVSEIEK